jgi:orotate phosphoribosyltransferase
MDYKTEFIMFMARAGALTFGDFITKSGRPTPYFVNTGKYSSGSQISRLGGFYADCILENAEPKPGTVLFGPAYKGIALAVSAAIALNARGHDVSYCFNRKEVKDHGEGGALVGHKLKEGDRVLIIEDVITAGTAVRETLPILKDAGATVEGLVISVDRMERGAKNITAIREIKEEYGIPTHAIVNVRDILTALRGVPVDGEILLGEDIAERMESYMREYCVR